MDIIINEALKNPLFELFLALAIGYALARIKFGSYSTGTLGVLIAAIFMGMMGLKIPAAIKIFGFLIFIYAVGIQSGPKILSIFRKKNIPFLVLAGFMYMAATAASFAGAKMMGLSRELYIGTFCGLFGHASALANIVTLFDMPMAQFSFSLSYPVALITILIFLSFVVKKHHIDETPEVDSAFSSGVSLKDEIIATRSILVKNRRFINKKLTIPQAEAEYGIVITEIMRKNKAIIPKPEDIIEQGDILTAQGYESNVEDFEHAAGKKSIPMAQKEGVLTWQILVTNKDLDGKSIGELKPRKNFGCVITRIWRSGVFIPAPKNHIELELGDSIVAAGSKENLDKLTKYVGKQDKAAGEIDFLSMGIVVTLGLLLGALTINMPFIGVLRLGMVGGVLIIALIVGNARRIGFISGQMSPSSRVILRDMGVTFFILGVGIESGALFLNSDPADLIKVLQASLLISIIFLISIYIIMLIARRSKKPATILSIFCGTATCTPGLGILLTETGNDDLMIPFASVYPISQVLVILQAQLMFMVY